MAKRKLKIGILFGGKSAEHEVSVETAKFVINSLDRNKYTIESIKIPKNGRFNFNKVKNFDLIFPVLHGSFGEDGSMQGLLKLAGVPFVGAGILGSAVGLDKDIMKKLLRDAGIPIGKFITFRSGSEINFDKIKKGLNLPMFIKPANAGSSVGISKVRNEEEFKQGIYKAFKFDTKIIIEEMVQGREIECGVIGNGILRVSVPGEIIAPDGFYTYEAKSGEGIAEYVIPAKISNNASRRVQRVAAHAYRALECEGMGRVDLFLKKDGKILVNEINTIPGPVMFRKLWEVSGLPYQKLLDKLIAFSIQRFKKESKLKTTK